ncbi:glutathione synthetase ATP-binding domain-like protein [Lojkania enalia]|uniref:Glutathione synthetase ATP-binding domain-like protein n=1 Tax=Lojkania enalia TaxID=147567 RepID=A0A9P4MYL0_9PLEO|nr:glutathione synthetase ATP-binding domain-like protein [Didymosphaeria enalia]
MIDLDLPNRLSFGWLLSDMPQRKTIALVHGRDRIEAAQPLCETARDLGMDLIILDKPGHWLLDPIYTHLYSRFEPLDMTIDEGFPQRIVSALRNHRVDGICTVSDRCLLPVAKAASMLGLPTEPPEAFSKSIDKSQTRLLNCEQMDFLVVSGVSELQERIASRNFTPKYPLIVKPSIGWSSEYVFKVQSITELSLASERVASRPNSRILIETYIDGPEVDANFVLFDGKVIFFEVSDDLPSAADKKGAGMDADFFETANVLPSALPQKERDIIRSHLHSILLDVGFRTGIFHLEARIINSEMEYKYADGYLDLRSRSQRAGGNPRCFLLEINPRPPGFQSVYATRLTYGVDYFALHLLRCLDDKARFQKFSQAFNERTCVQNKSEYWCSIVFFTGGKGGICRTADAFGDLLARKSHLGKNIAMAMAFYSEGDKIPDSTPEGLVFLGFSLVTSRVSRSLVRHIGDEIRSSFRLEVLS